jgi:hypothetical protein
MTISAYSLYKNNIKRIVIFFYRKIKTANNLIKLTKND